MFVSTGFPQKSRPAKGRRDFLYLEYYTANDLLCQALFLRAVRLSEHCAGGHRGQQRVCVLLHGLSLFWAHWLPFRGRYRTSNTRTANEKRADDFPLAVVMLLCPGCSCKRSRASQHVRALSWFRRAGRRKFPANRIRHIQRGRSTPASAPRNRQIEKHLYRCFSI